MFDAIRLVGVRGMTIEELVTYTRRPLPVVAVAIRDLHSKALIRRRMIKGHMYWSVDR